MASGGIRSLRRSHLQRGVDDELLAWQRRIEGYARDYGLDFFPVVFTVLSYAQMNEVAAYGGFPTRYPHWRFGMEYEQIKKTSDWGLSRIYELVINNNPAVAYLLEGNTAVDQKLVMAHVYAHVDFFKNNIYFRATDQGRTPQGEPIRRWIDAFADHAAIVRRWVMRKGIELVEEFVDAALSLENLIDPHLPFLPPERRRPPRPEEDGEEGALEPALLRVEREYMRRFINPEEFVEAQREAARQEQEARRKRFPPSPVRDVIGFLVEHAPLERWEREILRVIRTESYYFLPQRQTKIMNEGWASYWHSRIMTERVCSAAEIVDYAERNAGVMATSPRSLNPYKLGVELFRHIEERWDKGRFGPEWDACDDMEARRNWDRRTGLGLEKIFEVRAIHNDVTFVDEFLTPEFVEAQRMYAFGFSRRHDRWEIESREFHKVKDRLLSQLTNGGNPVVEVLDANGGNRGELVLRHEHHGVDLRLDWARDTLVSLERVWKRPVELHTRLEEEAVVLRFDGEEHHQRKGGEG